MFTGTMTPGVPHCCLLRELTKLCTVSEHAPKQHLVVFTSSPTSQTATSTTPVLIDIFDSEDVRVKEVGEALKLRLGVKSGGKGLRCEVCRCVEACQRGGDGQ
jgi:hypothetical protein